MEIERRMRFSRVRDRYDAESYLSVYAPSLSSMKLHTFMLGIDAARRALVLISTPPFRIGSAARQALKLMTCMAE
jgi:hypothetical protein